MSTVKHAASLAVACIATLGTALAMADEAPSVKLEVRAPVDKAHATQVYRRIQGAAQQVCESLQSRELDRERLHYNCVKAAVDKAVAELGSRELTQIHLTQQGATL